jgi:hypothetical protein
VSSCRTIRPAFAPSAARTAISRARATLRASERLVITLRLISTLTNQEPARMLRCPLAHEKEFDDEHSSSADRTRASGALR